METMRSSGKRNPATRARAVSLDLTKRQDALDLKLLEAIERIERVRSKALQAVGALLAEEG